MKPPLFLFSLLLAVLNLQPGFSQKTISGKVTDGQAPIQGVSVLVEGTNNGTSTDAMGKYTISASPKDILVFSYVGMQNVEIMVEDVTQILNIELYPKVEKLDEVTVTKVKSKRKSQKDLGIEYKTDPNIIKTGFGYIHGQYSAYRLKTLDGSALNPAAITILDAIQGKFSGLVISRGFGGGEPSLFIRGQGKVIVELDGMVMTDIPMWLNVSNIERMGLIYGSVAARKWGNGIGGILIINTRMVQNATREPGTNQPYDRARLRDNLYAGDALDEDTVLRNGPAYLKELYASKDSGAAHGVYKKYVPNFGSSYAFVLDAYRCLLDKFGDEELAGEVLGNHTELFSENPLAMKALAYTYQQNGELKKANKLYKKLFVKRPNYVQSYLDLAGSYRETGDHEKAAQLYSRFGYLAGQGYFALRDSMMVSKIIDREFNNLLALEGDGILSKKQQRKLGTIEEDFNGTRLVFEWNDGEAEFELQFVNPEGRYYKTEHSLFADGELIREQKILGYTTEEFLIDDGMPGTWQVNVKYLGNKRLTPSYLKAVVYYNYGTAAQRKETKVFKMGLKDVNRELFKLNVPATITN